MMNDQQRLSPISQLVQQRHDGSLGNGIDALERFIKYVNIRVLYKSTGEECSLLLTSGELSDLPIREITEADFGEGKSRILAFPTARPSEPAESAIGTHENDIKDAGWELPIDTAALRNVRHRFAVCGIWLPLDMNRASDRLHQAEHRFK